MSCRMWWPMIPIKNDNPDKGTKTVRDRGFTAAIEAIKNDNPDKGTKTHILLFPFVCKPCRIKSGLIVVF